MRLKFEQKQVPTSLYLIKTRDVVRESENERENGLGIFYVISRTGSHLAFGYRMDISAGTYNVSATWPYGMVLRKAGFM